jgi:hypothetical protein
MGYAGYLKPKTSFDLSIGDYGYTTMSSSPIRMEYGTVVVKADPVFTKSYCTPV